MAYDARSRMGRFGANSAISRGQFLRTAGVGAAAIGAASMGFGGVARAAGNILNVGPTRTYTTIAAAVAVATPGDTIMIDAGHYAGALIPMPLNIVGSGIGQTYIDTPYKYLGAVPVGFILKTASGTRISNLEINCQWPYPRNSGVLALPGNSNVTVSNIKVTNANFLGIYFQYSSNDCLVENCTIDNCLYGIWFSSTVPITGNKILNNLINNNPGFGIYLWGTAPLQNTLVQGNKMTGYSYVGIYLRGAAYNNYILGNDLRGATAVNHVLLNVGADNNTFRNNDYGPIDITMPEEEYPAGIFCVSNNNVFTNENFTGIYPGINGTPPYSCMSFPYDPAYAWNPSGNVVSALKNNQALQGFDLCTQILDGTHQNRINGYEKCTNVPQDVLDHFAELSAIKLNKLNALEELPGF